MYLLAVVTSAGITMETFVMLTPNSNWRALLIKDWDETLITDILCHNRYTNTRCLDGITPTLDRTMKELETVLTKVLSLLMICCKRLELSACCRLSSKVNPLPASVSSTKSIIITYSNCMGFLHEKRRNKLNY